MGNTKVHRVDESAARRFLDGAPVALVGASDQQSSFGREVFRQLRSHGIDAVPVNPSVSEIDGVACYPDLRALPQPVDRVMVMVPADAAAAVVDQAIETGARHVWLFRGLGGPGSASPEAIARCEEHGVDVVAGACPLMFLEPVGFAHRVHRAARRARHSLDRDATH